MNTDNKTRETAIRAVRIYVFLIAGLMSAIALSQEKTDFIPKNTSDSNVDGYSDSPLPVLSFPYIYSPPAARHSDAERMFQGIPSIAVTKGGRLWATWYGGGKKEGHNNYIMLASSGDGGKSWSDVLIVADPPFRASEPAVWVAPDGALWWMINTYPGARHLRDTGSQLWAMIAPNAEKNNPDWQKPRIIAMEMNNFNKPTVLSDGRWLFPTGVWNLDNSSKPIFSDDNGQSFYAGGEIQISQDVRNFEEYQVVERDDGSLWLLTRTNYGIGESFSTDGGKSWSQVKPSNITHTVSRFFITRLISGRLLLVKNGKIDADIGRSRMMAFLSDDDGKTWYGGLMLDERSSVSYPDGDQGSDGTIYITYDRERIRAKEILMASFTEEDVAAGKAVSDKAMLKQTINKAFGTNPRVSQQKQADAEPVPFITGKTPEVKAQNGEILPISAGEVIFNDRDYVWKEVPQIFDDKHFIQMSLSTGGSVHIESAGVIYVATPLPSVNTDSLQSKLIEQGFELSDHNEFALFEHPAARCVIFQKRVEPGEQIEIGKWGVVVF